MAGTMLRHLAAPAIRQTLRQPLTRPVLSIAARAAAQAAFRPAIRPFSSTPVQNATLMQVLRVRLHRNPEHPRIMPLF
ncbi:hypothetical protein IMZ48_02895 [Candidatus Bathyarchaeota archaeon]|nr:hypothetical protein [Candidatus Bathyarchaeota archaeon]